MDIAIETLRAICNGNAALLPRLIVHDADGWKGPAMPDNKGRIHLSDKMLLECVAPNLPLRFIGRHNATSIELAFDLQDHNLHHDGKAAPIQTIQERQELLRTTTGRDAKTAKHKDE